jgi:hypothetical protein
VEDDLATSGARDHERVKDEEKKTMFSPHLLIS